MEGFAYRRVALINTEGGKTKKSQLEQLTQASVTNRCQTHFWNVLVLRILKHSQSITAKIPSMKWEMYLSTTGFQSRSDKTPSFNLATVLFAQRMTKQTGENPKCKQTFECSCDFVCLKQWLCFVAKHIKMTSEATEHSREHKTAIYAIQ